MDSDKRRKREKRMDGRRKGRGWGEGNRKNGRLIEGRAMREVLRGKDGKGWEDGRRRENKRWETHGRKSEGGRKIKKVIRTDRWKEGWQIERKKE